MAVGSLVGQRVLRWRNPEVVPKRFAGARRSRWARSGIYAGVIAALVGIGLVATGLAQYYQAKPPSNQSARTTGVITSAATKEHRCTDTASFVFHGQRYSAATRISLDSCHFAVGERAPVSYDPSDPSSASVVLPTSETLGLADVGMIVGLIGAALASCVLVGSRKREPHKS